jgi:glycosyltransferase involved in cell wall biosynthesis
MQGFGRYLELYRKVKNVKNKESRFIIMNPSHILTVFVRIMVGNRVVLDAGWPLLDGLITRETSDKFSMRKLKIYCIDFFAAHFATLIFLETHAQLVYYSNLFFISKKKCKVLFTGVNENKFANVFEKQIKKESEKETNFKVFYRGQHTPLAAIEILAKASILLEDYNIDFEIFSPGLPNDVIFSKKTLVHREFQKDLDAISKSFNESSLVIGFLSFHKRLSRTIPHKAFEAAFFGKPYLTVSSVGVSEFLESGVDAIIINTNNTKDLAEIILYLSSHQIELVEYTKNIREKYLSVSSQDVLTDQFLSALSHM